MLSRIRKQEGENAGPSPQQRDSGEKHPLELRQPGALVLADHLATALAELAMSLGLAEADTAAGAGQDAGRWTVPQAVAARMRRNSRR